MSDAELLAGFEAATLASEHARRTFLLPDRLALP